MLILGYLGALATGVSLGLIGGGGSILIVPVLVYLFSTSPSLATAYSLFVVGAASLVGAYGYHKRGLIDYKTAAVFAVPSFIGVFAARTLIVPNLPEVMGSLGPFTITKDGLIMVVFASVMLVAAVSMIKKGKSKTNETDDSTEETGDEPSFNYKMIGLEGLGVGALTGFVGAGGGFLIIPALVLLAKLPMKLAVGTSLLIISVKSLLGFMGDLTVAQTIDWPTLLSVTGAAMAGIFIGARLSKIVPGHKLKPAFGWFVLVMGVYILGRQLI